MCPCQFGRLGAFLLTACLYWAWALGGLPAMLAALHAGDILAVAWAGAALFGAGWLLIGIGEALSHADPFNPRSILWSAGVIALAGYALSHGWVFGGNALLFHLSRAAWFGWIASEVFNLWLNLRGLGRRREVDASPVCAPGRQEVLTGPRFRRRRRLEWVEDVEASGDIPCPAAPPPGFSIRAAAGPVGQDQPLPQIVYVKDKNGQFVPLPGAVPLDRRR